MALLWRQTTVFSQLKLFERTLHQEGSESVIGEVSLSHHACQDCDRRATAGQGLSSQLQEVSDNRNQVLKGKILGGGLYHQQGIS